MLTMTRVFLLLLFSGMSISLQSQSSAKFKNFLKIEYEYGDEAHNVEEMIFEVRNHKVIGRITFPNTDKVLSSEVELSSSQIDTINSFIALVERYKSDECVEKAVSSWVQIYNVSKDNDSIEIRRFCDWGKFTFFDIKRLVFEKYLISLEVRKVAVNLEYFKVLKGKWSDNSLLDKLGLTSTCDLTKLSQGVDPDGFVEFTEPYKVVISRKDKKVYYNCHLEFNDDKVFIVLYGDDKRNGEEFVYGHKFLIIILSENKMKLIRA